MKVHLIIVRYPKWLGWAGFLSMAFFRLPLWLNKDIQFWKLMGCGRNGTFDKTPDWRQWAVLLVDNRQWTIDNSNDQWPMTNDFLSRWWRFFRCEKWVLDLTPIEGHGLWDGKEVFGQLAKQTNYDGPIAVLTRATIRLNKLSSFWKHVDSVANQMATAPGFICSVGIGEVPWIKQATFSIWESKESMKNFAYRFKEHAEVVRKTRQEQWYSEEMFVRFIINESIGTLNGKQPFKIKS